MTLRRCQGMRPLWCGIGLVGLGLGLSGCGSNEDAAPAPRSQAATRTAAPAGSLAELGDRVRQGEAPALASLLEKLPAPANGTSASAPLTEAEAIELIDLADAVRGGYPRFASKGKATILEVSYRILERFRPEGIPAGWSKVLAPTYDILSAGLSDADPALRKQALDHVANLWSWGPGRTMTPAEEQSLATWKEHFYPLVKQRLGDTESVSRMAAVACLGTLPIDEKAEPAIACLRDRDFSVRYQTLAAFASRPTLLTEDAILPLLHDPVPDLKSLAEKILTARGLNPDLIGLGRMITHERPEMRASAIGLLERREDIDPIIWLLRLSEDPDVRVRLKAVEAFAGRITPEVRQRLREIAAADDNAEVRAAAEKLAPVDTTAALPPLPGSASLRPKAN